MHNKNKLFIAGRQPLLSVSGGWGEKGDSQRQGIFWAGCGCVNVMSQIKR